MLWDALIFVSTSVSLVCFVWNFATLSVLWFPWGFGLDTVISDRAICMAAFNFWTYFLQSLCPEILTVHLHQIFYEIKVYLLSYNGCSCDLGFSLWSHLTEMTPFFFFYLKFSFAKFASATSISFARFLLKFWILNIVIFVYVVCEFWQMHYLTILWTFSFQSLCQHLFLHLLWPDSSKYIKPLFDLKFLFTQLLSKLETSFSLFFWNSTGFLGCIWRDCVFDGWSVIYNDITSIFIFLTVFIPQVTYDFWHFT